MKQVESLLGPAITTAKSWALKRIGYKLKPAVISTLVRYVHLN